MLHLHRIIECMMHCLGTTDQSSTFSKATFSRLPCKRPYSPTSGVFPCWSFKCSRAKQLEAISSHLATGTCLVCVFSSAGEQCYLLFYFSGGEGALFFWCLIWFVLYFFLSCIRNSTDKSEIQKVNLKVFQPVGCCFVVC